MRANSLPSPRAVASAAFIAGPANGAISMGRGQQVHNLGEQADPDNDAPRRGIAEEALPRPRRSAGRRGKISTGAARLDVDRPAGGALSSGGRSAKHALRRKSYVQIVDRAPARSISPSMRALGTLVITNVDGLIVAHSLQDAKVARLTGPRPLQAPCPRSPAETEIVIWRIAGRSLSGPCFGGGSLEGKGENQAGEPPVPYKDGECEGAPFRRVRKEPLLSASQAALSAEWRGTGRRAREVIEAFVSRASCRRSSAPMPRPSRPSAAGAGTSVARQRQTETVARCQPRRVDREVVEGLRRTRRQAARRTGSPPEKKMRIVSAAAEDRRLFREGSDDVAEFGEGGAV